MTVALVVVSHSGDVARGLVAMTRQMAADVPLEAAGGTDEGGIGTSFDRIETAVRAALDASGGAGAVVLCDLGSAVLTAETALELLDDDEQALVRLVDAPLVEGAVAAGVAAQQGDDLARVAATAEAAWGRAAPAAPAAEAAEGASSGEDAATTVTVVNELGLHARPAAELVKTATRFESDVTIGGVDAASILRVVALGSKRGDELEIRATGSDAQAAVDALRELVESGFGED